MKTKITEYKSFYKGVLSLALPIMLQNGITNFVNFLDNLMIGKVGTEEMTGVGIVGQLMFIFYLCLFGAVSGAGIFTAQFFGQKNTKGVRDTFRFKLIVNMIIMAGAIVVFVLFSDPLISLFLQESNDGIDIAKTLGFGRQYLFIMLIGMFPYAVETAYSDTLRGTGQTFIPMLASVIAVFLNLFLNYILIYGKLGLPALGVAGAAYATVITRFIQATIVIIWTHKNKEECSFIEGAYNSFLLQKGLTKKIIILGVPLLINETLWAAGMTAQIQAYSARGVAVVAALNINSNIFNLFSVLFIALGDAVAILVGQQLGAGNLQKAKQTAYRIIAFSVFICLITGTVLYFLGPVIPNFYNTTDEVKVLAGSFIKVMAVCMPISGFMHCAYFTIRSGGKTIITFLFDSAFLWVVTVPVAYYLSRYTDTNIVIAYLLTSLCDLIKLVVSLVLLKTGVWMNNLVGENQ